MRRISTIAAAALATAWSLGCVDVTGPVFDQPDWEWPFTRDTTGFVGVNFEWHGAIAQGDQIEIKGIFGDIRATWTAGNEVVVNATKRGLPDDLADVDIEVLVHAGGVTICAVYPDVPGARRNECAPGADGNMAARDSSDHGVEVEFSIQVPEGVVFAGRTIKGHIDATDLRSDAFVSTVFGNVRVATTRLATAKTVAGWVEASIGLADWGRDLGFQTVNGNITVTIPAGTNAEVHANVVSGNISSDFPLGQPTAGSVHGTIGTGGRTLTLSAVQGDIALRRGS